MSKAASLLRDPRYPAFVERYAFDALRFAIEVCGLEPTWQQVELLNAVSNPGCRVSVASGHGCFARGTQMMRASGEPVAVEDVLVGDQLMGPDGAGVRNVLQLKRGRETLCRVTYADGSGHTVNESHILVVADSEDGELREVVVRDWLADPNPPRYCRRMVSAPGAVPRFAAFPIAAVERLEEGDYYGFTVDADHRFLGADGTVLRNTGKTASFGVIGLWHLLVYRNSNCICTGPRLKTVNDGIWQEFTAHKAEIEKGPHAWIAKYFVIESQKVYVVGHKLDWWITAKTAPVGRPDNIAGSHNDWLLWICDESSGIPDANFGVIGGSLTDARNRLVCASQPLRSSGYFYDTHHRLSSSNGGVFTSLTFNSEESPIVSVNFLREKLMEYGGRDAPEYQIKVRGMFPENNDKYLLGRSMIEKLIDADPVIKPGEFFGNLLVVDVGAGVHRDKTVATHLRLIGNGDRVDPDPRRVEVVSIPIYTNALDWTPTAKLATEYAAGLSNCTVIVDTHGMGIQFAKKMEEFGCPNVIKSNWGNKPFKKRYKERFFNLRAQCSVHAAEAVKDGRITFIGDYQKDLLDQGSRIPFYIDESGRWHIARKEDMAADGLPSPDLWDTVCMAFLETATYIQADDSFVAGEGIDREERAALLAELETA